MNRLTKRALSLALALLMVLALIPAQPLTANAEDFTPGETWTYESAYAGKIEGAFTTSGDDFVFEADETMSWKAWFRSAVAVNAGINVKVTLTYNGQKLEKTIQGLSVAAGGTLELCSAGSFPEITDDMYGNFTLAVQIYHGTKLAATGVLNFVRNAPAGETTEPTEATEPTEPVVLDPPTKPGDVLWQYAANYEWLQGTVSTSNTTGIYKGWDAYDWAITLCPTKSSATVTVEANVVDHTGATVGTVTKDVDVAKAPTVTPILTPGELGLNNKTLGDFRVTAVIKHNGETVAQVQAVFGRRIGDAGYTAVEYLPGYEWITGKFTAADKDMTYVGIQKYDWRATIALIKSAATVDVAVTVVNAQGETVATLNKAGVECAKGATTALVTAGEIADLTADLYGKFAVTTVISIGAKAYAGIYGVFERVEGEFVPDTVAPEFGPANWENCGLPAAVTVTNNGEMNKPIEVTISIADAQGTVLASMKKTATVGAGTSGELVTINQLRNFFTERGATYYVVIEGRWTNGYDEYTIDETLTYVWTEHTDTEVVPGYAATCTETGLTDGVYCHGCEYIITEQEELPVDPDAHTFSNGVCTICGQGEPCEHRWSDASCTAPKTCTICGAIEGEALGHDMQETSAAISADCVNTGKTAVYTCANGCGKTEGGEEIPALGHNYENNVCTNCQGCLLRFSLNSTGDGYTVYAGESSVCGELVIPATYNGLPVTRIGYHAFSYCDSLTSVIIPNSVTSIDDAAFFRCYELTSVTIPDSVTSIGNEVFTECFSLTNVTIPDSVTSIGDWAFYLCRSLTSVTIPNSVTIIGYWAFSSCGSLTSVTIPDSVTSIGDGVFRNCSSLTSVTIGNGITIIGDSAFCDCYNLTSVTIPDGVTIIGEYAFAGCRSLTSVTIPDSVTNIYYSAFRSCSGLTSVIYCGTQEQWDAITIGESNTYLTNAILRLHNYENCVCTVCGEAKHSWVDASCTAPRTCDLCGATEGEALGHTPAEAVKENEVPATTLAEGSYDEVVYCAVCGAELSRKTVVVEKLSTVVSVVVSQDTLFRGDTVTVTVSISPLENCAAGGFLFEFDTDTFEYVSGEALVSDFGSAGVSTVNGRIAGYFMNGNETVKGSIFQITLRVKDTAAFADYTISGVPSLGVKVGDTSEHISCEANAATVTVACSHSYSQWAPIDEMWEKHTCSICGNEETQLIEYTVIYQYADGTVISEAVYHYGDTIVVPDEPPAQAANNVFVGWDKEIDVCTGNTVYTAVFVEYVPGDMDGNGIVDFDDAVYLLLNLMFGDVSYPLSYAPADIDRNGIVDYDDAVYLLLHTLFGNVIYPL